MRRVATAAVITLLLGAIASAGDIGTTGAQTFRRIVAARPTGLGEAFTAVGGEIDALPYNPSGLAKLAGPSLSTTYQRGFSEQNFGAVSYAHTLPFGSLFIGGGFFDAGTFQINQSDGTQGKRRAQQDTIGMAGVAFGRDIPFSVGITGKVLRSELAEAAQATVAAMDAGALWETPLSGLTLGAAVQNLGPDIKYESEGDPLPRTYRAGVSYLLDLASLGIVKQFPYLFFATVDGVKTKDEQGGVHAGLEVRRSLMMADTEGSAALRGGYRSEAQAFDVGVGFVVANVSFDYTLGLVSDLDVTHRFTIGYRFLPKKKRTLKLD